MPIDELVEIFNRVAFPVYRIIREDTNRLKRAIIRNLVVFWSISLILCLGIYVLSPVFIPFILGQTWVTIISYIKLLSVTGFLIALSTPVNPIFLATTNQRYLTYTTLIQMVCILLLVYPLTHWYGMHGTIWAYNLSLIIALPIRWYFALRCL